ncbi:RDD family protein [Pseudomonas cichorii]|uniref:RDD family protein n=1 Tax=Pseudomonas cichorii TaxID=36746 RepID=UPI001C88E397|nr:RDD family protein [Pseudomonas cichorii]MBX8487200.1 RDD family protein [Pseudomonas cichorii]MBX8515290.1 RDD family protein [Pseudomonas cichorii]MBX8575139.1 RDD family protein [Pseudomonas cichorii]MBX8604506.1 RDD family protein [Pseudomonas cichorii]
MSRHLLRPQGDFAPAGLARRLAAICYDAFLCFALQLVTAFVYKLVLMAFIGEARLRVLSESGSLDGDPLLSSILLLVTFGFFAKFWTHGGQTLGMQVWGIRVQNADGTAISLMQALLRFIVSIASWLCLGLGFVWCLFDKQQRTWHDMYSGTLLVKVPKQK